MKRMRIAVCLILALSVMLSISPLTALAHDQTAAPKNVKAVASADLNDKYIKLTWDAADRASGYDIFRTTGDSFSDKPYATVKGGTSFVDRDIKADKTYKYRIRAFHMHLLVPKRSEYSKTVSASWVSMKGITLSNTDITLAKPAFSNGAKYTLTAAVSPQNASDQRVKWSSTKSEVVSVKKGELTPKAVGDSTIYAQNYDGRIIVKCIVHVVDMKQKMDEVSLRQNVSGPCVLYSITMMLMRQQIYCKYPLIGQPDVTYDKVYKWNGNAYSAKWWNTSKNDSNWEKYKGSLDKNIMSNTGFNTGAQNASALGSNGEERKNKVIELLGKNPEGVVAYFYASDSKQHAVLITDCIDGVLYVGDPADDAGREKLEDSALAKTIFKTGADYNKLFGYLNCIYYSIN